MKLILNLFIALLLISVLAGSTIFGLEYMNKTVCDRTLYWDIGIFDTEFKISRQDYIANIQAAENVWEKPFGRNLFEHKPGADFKINLIYDERQALSDERLRLDKEITLGKESFDQLKSQYQAIINDYETRLKTYDQRVKSWNQQGGAPKDIYDQLENERKLLEQSFQRIKRIEVELQKYSKSINTKVDNYNHQADHAYYKGIYNGQEINIYEFQGQNELRLALAHELGHAIELGHTDNPESIMYPTLKDQPTKEINLTQDDIAALNEVCAQ